MFLTRIAVNNPVFATMVMVALMVFGVYSYQRLPIEQAHSGSIEAASKLAFDGLQQQKAQEQRTAAYEARLTAYSAENSRLSVEEAADHTASLQPAASTSEQGTGYCADILSPDCTEKTAAFAETRAYEWLTAYAAEYGAGIDELSSISFLRFIHGDKRGKFAQVGSANGIVGGEGFHVVDGNDRITTGLADRLAAPVQLGHKLVAVRKLASGRVRLTFDVGGRSVQSDHDAVVLTLPFSVLRDVKLDASLELPAWKRYAIKHAAMGDNSKLMVGFNRPYWYIQHGSSGTGFGDRSHLNATWESNAYNGNEHRAVLTTQVGGTLARSLDAGNVQKGAKTFLDQLESALPGAHQAAQRTASGKVVAFAQNWSRNPYSKGAYSHARPGYFTMIAHNEAKAVGNVMFAGEHTSSFYEWQGTMEGAALSGLRAAAEACTLLRVR